MGFSFVEKVSMRSQGFTRNEIEATERAWTIVPEAVEMLLAEHGTQLYFNGQLTTANVNVGEDVALLADGTPVVLRVAQGHNDFPWHEIYNPDGVDAYREEIFQREYAAIKLEDRKNMQHNKHSWAWLRKPRQYAWCRGV